MNQKEINKGVLDEEGNYSECKAADLYYKLSKDMTRFEKLKIGKKISIGMWEASTRKNAIDNDYDGFCIWANEINEEESKEITCSCVYCKKYFLPCHKYIINKANNRTDYILTLNAIKKLDLKKLYKGDKK